MEVNWIKCEGNKWCSLNTVNLDHPHFNNMDGVYIIWHGGTNPATVRIGQGVMKDRLLAHRNDKQIQNYQNLGLYVTWAAVSKQSQDGVEAYLAQQLKPKVGERYPNVTLVCVNLPW